MDKGVSSITRGTAKPENWISIRTHTFAYMKSICVVCDYVYINFRESAIDLIAWSITIYFFMWWKNYTCCEHVYYPIFHVTIHANLRRYRIQSNSILFWACFVSCIGNFMFNFYAWKELYYYHTTSKNVWCKTQGTKGNLADSIDGNALWLMSSEWTKSNKHVLPISHIYVRIAPSYLLLCKQNVNSYLPFAKKTGYGHGLFSH